MMGKYTFILMAILLASFSSLANAQEIPHTPRYYYHRAEGYISSADYKIGEYQLPTVAGTTFTPNNTTQTYGGPGFFMLNTATIKM